MFAVCWLDDGPLAVLRWYLRAKISCAMGNLNCPSYCREMGTVIVNRRVSVE